MSPHDPNRARSSAVRCVVVSLAIYPRMTFRFVVIEKEEKKTNTRYTFRILNSSNSNKNSRVRGRER